MRSSRSYLILGVVCFLLLAGLASAAGQDSAVPIEVNVSKVTGPRLTVDRGSSSGIEPGDIGRFRSFAGEVREGAVISVTENAAQIELNDLASAAPLAVGARGEVLVPSGRARPDGSTARAGKVPEHPPWQEPVGPWAPGKPKRKPVITSSIINTAPLPVQTSRRVCRKPSVGGTQFILPATGSTMTQATLSPISAKARRTPSLSL